MSDGHQRGWEAVAVQAGNQVLNWHTRQHRRGRRMRFNVMVKPEFRRSDSELLERRVYRVR